MRCPLVERLASRAWRPQSTEETGARWRLSSRGGPASSTGEMVTVPARNRRNIYYWKCDRAAAFHGTDVEARNSPAIEVQAILLPYLRRRLNDPALTVRDAGTQGNHLTYLAESGETTYFVRVENGPEQDDYMEVEAAVLDVVRQTGVPTPRVILADSSWRDVPFACQVLEFISHVDLNRIDKTGSLAEREIAEQIGRYVATWQQIQPSGFGPFDPARCRDGGELVGLHADYESYFRLNWNRHLSFLEANGFLNAGQTRSLRKIVDEHSDLLRIERGCLVHKDLALWNVLGTPERVEAVIDWDDVISGDATDDLSLLACFHDGAFLSAVVGGYETVRPLPEEFLPRFWLHLLRNMVVKATIRVGAGYFNRDDTFFLLPAGHDGASFERLTRERLWLAFEVLRLRRPFTHLA
jgi:fructosamine-3-kinase